MNLSIVIPARNEAASLLNFLPALRAAQPGAEIIVVDDGSTDATAEIVRANGMELVQHSYARGNGAAIKAGVRHASGEVIVCMDADGQHRPEEIDALLARLAEGYDMVVGARNRAGQASMHRSFANGVYNRFASWMVGHRIEDLTSGFRAFKAEQFREFLSLLPNGFSYPTTSTMCFFRAGYGVSYVPINVLPRIGKSHIQLTRDGIRFLLIIFKIGTLFSPIKLFAPIALMFLLAGLGLYGYTFAIEHRFTNMSALLMSNAVLIFLIGLVAEQITALMHVQLQKK
ncbi:Undecaprenyl-phosphate mannosyltransferase [Andreprevotia sp. IGB-42]|uniref:glycosyltransferase family 2 protein n=1 Tax=Andreprevotia sp. IGB-42 TaxID=2497473 RepID=UPI00135C5F0B|nr:glycosyltransferase family 2 protein [Andreprevotia sp. IGB-42]KAF0811498.1 Undecaprenyl-phosphate mannosyltransferase [Andreprevotia sp. IGB-42]